MGNARYWLLKLRESFFSALPIAIVIVAFFLVARFGVPQGYFPAEFMLTDTDIYSFLIAAVMIVVGMTLLTVGTEQSMSEIGVQIGGSLM